MTKPTPKLQSATAAALLALRELGLAIAEARPDGDELLARLKSGRLRIVLDEQSGGLTFGQGQGEGLPVTWLETVQCHPEDESSFGRLASSVLGTATTKH